MYKYFLWLHIVAIISWMAGLLYLIRLFVYHAEEKESVVKSRFEVMEKRLYKVITTPSMVLSFLLGIGMVSLNMALLTEGWFHLKLFLTILMAGITGFCGAEIKKLKTGRIRSHKFYRFFNEVPTILMIIIVALVILRPFQ